MQINDFQPWFQKDIIFIGDTFREHYITHDPLKLILFFFLMSCNTHLKYVLFVSLCVSPLPWPVSRHRTNVPLHVALPSEKNAKWLIEHAHNVHPHEGPMVSSPTSVTHTIFPSIDFYVQLQGWSSW